MRHRFLRVMLWVSALSVMAMAISLAVTAKPGKSPFVPPAFDANAAKGVPDVPEALDWQELDAQDFHAGICGVITLSENKANVWLTNPENNRVWLKVRILSHSGEVLGESGLIQPGEYIQSVALEPAPEPGTEIVLKIMAYEPETYHSAGAVSLNTQISG